MQCETVEHTLVWTENGYAKVPSRKYLPDCEPITEPTNVVNVTVTTPKTTTPRTTRMPTTKPPPPPKPLTCPDSSYDCITPEYCTKGLVSQSNRLESVPNEASFYIYAFI